MTWDMTIASGPAPEYGKNLIFIKSGLVEPIYGSAYEVSVLVDDNPADFAGALEVMAKALRRKVAAFSL